MAALRSRFPDLIVAACNLTGPRVGADVTFAVDRAMVEALLVDEPIVGEVACPRVLHDAVMRERAADIPLHRWGRAVDLAVPEEGTGAGLAAFCALAAEGPDALVVVGFDGAKDPRTRWQGERGYRASPSSPALLDRWIEGIEVEAARALACGAIGAYADPSGRIEVSPAAAFLRGRLREVGRLALAVATLALRSRQEEAPCPA